MTKLKNVLSAVALVLAFVALVGILLLGAFVEVTGFRWGPGCG